MANSALAAFCCWCIHLRLSHWYVNAIVTHRYESIPSQPISTGCCTRPFSDHFQSEPPTALIEFPFHCGSKAVPAAVLTRFHPRIELHIPCNVRAVPVEYQSDSPIEFPLDGGFNAVSTRFQRGSNVVPTWFQCGSNAVPSADWAPFPVQCQSRASGISVQFPERFSLLTSMEHLITFKIIPITSQT